MAYHRPGSVSRLVLLSCDVVLMIIAWFNIVSLRETADLPGEYQAKVRGLSSSAAGMGASRAVLQIGGHPVDSPELLRYYLSRYTKGDSVTVRDVSSNIISERTIGLAARHTPFGLGTILAVGSVFFVFGLYVILMHSSGRFAGVLHALTVGTALMILYDWGSLKVYPAPFSALCWFIFDVAVWMLPSLFLHLSFIYPEEKRGHTRLLIFLFYAVSLSGIGVSAYYLVQIFFCGVHIHDTPYLSIHGRVNDAFLIGGLLCTVANLERSALAIQDPYDRKRIYWVLLGIFFGPLVYVFLILVPRMMLEYELVSQSIMQYTLLMAPLMFYLAIRKTPNRTADQPIQV